MRHSWMNMRLAISCCLEGERTTCPWLKPPLQISSSVHAALPLDRGDRGPPWASCLSSVPPLPPPSSCPPPAHCRGPGCAPVGAEGFHLPHVRGRCQGHLHCPGGSAGGGSGAKVRVTLTHSLLQCPPAGRAGRLAGHQPLSPSLPHTHACTSSFVPTEVQAMPPIYAFTF
jgi:hypothetical protein